MQSGMLYHRKLGDLLVVGFLYVRASLGDGALALVLMSFKCFVGVDQESSCPYLTGWPLELEAAAAPWAACCPGCHYDS